MYLDEIEMTKFPGGELHPTIKEDFTDLCANIRNSDDIMKLLLVTDAYKRLHSGRVFNLYLPYIPYARQDRVANRGESLAIKVFAELINAQEYPSVHVLDPHSDISTALINNIVVTDSTVFARKVWKGLLDEYKNEAVIVAPDAGALKKTHKIAKAIDYEGEVVFCEKQRNTKTGEITGTRVYCDDIEGKTFIMFDDIADGSKTFVEIAKVLNSKGAKKVILVVSHGLFSKGLDIVFNHIDEVFCTDSFRTIEHTFNEGSDCYFKQYNALELMQGYDKEQLLKDIRKAI